MQPAPLQHGDDFGGGIGGSKVSLPYPGLAEVHSGALMEELSSGSMSMTPFSGTRVGTAPIGGFRGGSKGAGGGGSRGGSAGGVGFSPSGSQRSGGGGGGGGGGRGGRDGLLDGSGGSGGGHAYWVPAPAPPAPTLSVGLYKLRTEELPHSVKAP
jgi:hypothetical protein